MKQSCLTQNLKELRTLARLSQSQLSDIILAEFDYDLPRQKYGAYEEGRNEPSISTLKILSRFYGCSVDDLISDNTLVDSKENRVVVDSLGLRIQLAALEQEYSESRFKVIKDHYKMLKYYYSDLLELYSKQNKEIIIEAPWAKPDEIIFVSLEHTFTDLEIYRMTKEINWLAVVLEYLSTAIFPTPKFSSQPIKLLSACNE